jgi:acyl-CoA thioester hydrolase
MSETVSRINFIVTVGDLDNNHHMNNATYAAYFEQGRQDLFKRYSLDPLSLAPRGISLFVRKAEYFYAKPLEEGDEFAVETSFGEIEGRLFFISNQTMFHNGERVAASKTRYVFVDLKTGRHISPPKDLVEKLV